MLCYQSYNSKICVYWRFFNIYKYFANNLATAACTTSEVWMLDIIYHEHVNGQELMAVRFSKGELADRPSRAMNIPHYDPR